MADKSNFTPDEWKLLLESMTMAGIAISAADPSGLWGLLKESFAEGSALVAAKTDSTARPLIKAPRGRFSNSRRPKQRTRWPKAKVHRAKACRNHGQMH